MNTKDIKTLIPFEELEPPCLQQMYEVAKHDFVTALAMMPDAHTGFDMPVGCVAMADGFIVPAWVGVDIGCGMCWLDTGLTPEALGLTTVEKRRSLFDRIQGRVPMGFKGRVVRQDYPRKFPCECGDKGLKQSIDAKAGDQIGTLGGGNHFISIDVSRNNGTVGVIIHSGSRNPGKQIADWYIKNAPKFLSVNSPLGAAYFQDMMWAIEFALQNRLAMLNMILDCLGMARHELGNVANETHNHAIIQDDGKVLHRKGATPASNGHIGVIPGNMRDGTYITEGLGNQEYLCSASHGAGRLMGRNQAKKTLDLAEFERGMEGIVAPVSASTLDESPMAYKDLETVVARQDGIVVKVLDHYRPIIVCKG